MRGGVFLLQAPAERAEGLPECCGVGGWIEEMGGLGEDERPQELRGDTAAETAEAAAGIDQLVACSLNGKEGNTDGRQLPAYVCHQGEEVAQAGQPADVAGGGTRGDIEGMKDGEPLVAGVRPSVTHTEEVADSAWRHPHVERTADADNACDAVGTARPRPQGKQPAHGVPHEDEAGVAEAVVVRQ